MEENHMESDTQNQPKKCECGGGGCESSVFEKLGAKYTFVFGAIAGILTLCTVGFFILLGIVFNGGSTFGGTLVQADEPDEYVPLEDGDSGISVKPVSDDDHVRGNKKAKVTLIEFSDVDCPFCQRFHDTTKDLLAKNDDVRVVFRHFPLDSLHPEARTKAIATECAAEQGKFWELLDAIFEGDETASDLGNLAGKAGINKSKFQKCVDDKKYAKAVSDDQADGAAAGAQGTPYSVIVGPNGELEVLSGAQPLEAIETAIAKYL